MFVHSDPTSLTHFFLLDPCLGREIGDTLQTQRLALEIVTCPLNYQSCVADGGEAGWTPAGPRNTMPEMQHASDLAAGTRSLR